MKIFVIVLGLLALLMAVEASRSIVDLAKKGSEENSSEENQEIKELFGFLHFVVDVSSLLKQFVTNVDEIKSRLDNFGGAQNFRDYVVGPETRLLLFAEEEGQSQSSGGSQPSPPAPTPQTRSAKTARSMKELLAQLEKLTEKK